MSIVVEAKAILDSLQPLAGVKKHLDNLIAGENEAKQLIFLLLLSGIVPDPKMKQMILLKGPAGVGKTTLMNIADLFKSKTIGRLSATALDYIEDLSSYQVLKLQELGHMDYDRPLKFVSADDKGYTIEVTVPGKQEEGATKAPFKTFTKHIPAITLITSTTRISIEPQFRRRNWIINPDTSKEQTEKIRKWKIEQEDELDRLNQGLVPETSYDKSKQILASLVEMIKPCKVIIPFKDHLTQLLPADNMEVRGHYDKLLSLATLYGVLLQNQLPKLNGWPVLTAERALEILEISKDAFQAMSSMESRITQFIQLLDAEGFDKGFIIDKTKRIKLGRKMDRSHRTVLTYLNFLEDEGYLTSVRTGREKLFELVDAPKEMMRRFASLTSKLKNRDVVTLVLNLEADTYLTELCEEKGVEERLREELLKHFPISKRL